MTANNFQARVIGFLSPQSVETKEGQLLNATLGLVGEAGEFADALKKHKFHGKEFDRQAAILELGDVAFYLAEAADALDCTLEDVLLLNIDKLSKRYPTGKFTTKDSLEKKDELDLSKTGGTMSVLRENLVLNSAGVVYEGEVGL